MGGRILVRVSYLRHLDKIQIGQINVSGMA
jgi:hypothetical protein